MELAACSGEYTVVSQGSVSSMSLGAVLDLAVYIPLPLHLAGFPHTALASASK